MTKPSRRFRRGWPFLRFTLRRNSARRGARAAEEGRFCCGARTPGAFPENHDGASRSAVRRGLRRSRALLARGIAAKLGRRCAGGDSGAIYGGGECFCVEECGRKPRRDWAEHRRVLL